jgi:uncharacterized protein DUF6941
METHLRGPFENNRVSNGKRTQSPGGASRFGDNQMEVRYLLLARHAEANPDGTMSMIGGGLDIQVVSMLPCQFPVLFLVAKIAMTSEESGLLHALEFRVVTPSGEYLVTTKMDIPPTPSAFPPNRTYKNANTVLSFHNITFPIEGVYQFQLLYDGAVEKEAPFRVELQSDLSRASESPTEGEVRDV